MKRIPLLFIFALCAAGTVLAADHPSFKGTVIRMETRNCVLSNFRAKMASRPVSVASCPEYTVMTANVVYVVIARHGDDSISLTEDVEFQIVNNQLRLSKQSKSRFLIQTMMLRGDWEREEQRKELMMQRSVSSEAREVTLTAAAN